MLKLNSKFSPDDNVLANFAQIISSPVCLAVIHLLANQSNVTSQHIYTLPHPSIVIKKAIIKLEFTGLIKLSGRFYITDGVTLKHLSLKFNAFAHQFAVK
ncbi:hypothetical protein FO440_12280 [Mucilaginibacter corticis]|uniref:Uncharacterized protein n=1 Tax=Mucilaginibacter corticis TaxID=2597670 RepID=A0A556ML00_9SPHI|nr:hypothetical protein [Mucilaginibacter corticis]TSJ40525.1 hypothetical protein FO440_12280 [Mucilaginibacter corticis]